MDMTHQAGAKFGYTMSSGVMPVLNDFKDIGFDMLYHVDPVQGGADLEKVKESLAGRIAVLGGMNSALGRNPRGSLPGGRGPGPGRRIHPVAGGLPVSRHPLGEHRDNY
jgi:hypothetical protein